MATLEPLMERNFLEYASYVIVDRAIPDLRDGCKPVQRRILQTLFEMDDGKFHKVANVIGETMKLHPHGDASIGDALVVLANKEYFIERQGNFGNIITGHPAAAPRYIECRLTELARETLFNKALTEVHPSYDGRKNEPIFLPAKLPVLLMLGTEGIAVGMSTRILPHNLPELLEAQIKILKYEPVELYPDFPTGGIVDVTEYDEGRGKIRVRARIEADGDKRVVIREIPYGTTTESLIASIESAAQKGKVKIAAINDFTTDHVEIEVQLPRGVYADEVIPQLYAYTECEVSISSNMVIIKERHPVEMSANEVLRYLTDRLRDQISAELELALKELRDEEHWLTLEQIFIEKRVYKRIEEARTEEMVMLEVHEGMKPYRKELKRALTDDDVRRLLDIRIRRISKYDINRNRKQLRDVADSIEEVGAKLGALTQTTIQYIQGLLAKYGSTYPRRSQIARFEVVDRKAVAQQNIKVGYDPETGFFGSDVKGVDHQLTLSEYDRVLAIADDGSFRVVGPEAKILIPGKVLYLAQLDPERGKMFTIVYRDADRIAFAKKVHIHKFIRDKEYELIKGKEGKIDLLLQGLSKDTVKLSFVPKKRQRVSEAEFDLGALELTGVTARGTRLAPKPIARVKHVATGPREEQEPPLPPPRDSFPPRRSVPPPPPPPASKASAPPKKKNGDDDGPQRKLF
ncbi:MAG: DNA topoisomerase IV subunit A [Proteobacteria bacterium]|jgi:topoisomerase-4 subunit A|nr:DNA topoisomerase IV subunit A [Pseudomonadota bacterium]